MDGDSEESAIRSGCREGFVQCGEKEGIRGLKNAPGVKHRKLPSCLEGLSRVRAGAGWSRRVPGMCRGGDPISSQVSSFEKKGLSL